LKHKNDVGCKAKLGFYSDYAFIATTNSFPCFIATANDFPGFGTTGDLSTRKRELSALFGQTSHETMGNIFIYITSDFFLFDLTWLYNSVGKKYG